MHLYLSLFWGAPRNWTNKCMTYSSQVDTTSSSLQKDVSMNKYSLDSANLSETSEPISTPKNTVPKHINHWFPLIRPLFLRRIHFFGGGRLTSHNIQPKQNIIPKLPLPKAPWQLARALPLRRFWGDLLGDESRHPSKEQHISPKPSQKQY